MADVLRRPGRAAGCLGSRAHKPRGRKDAAESHAHPHVKRESLSESDSPLARALRPPSRSSPCSAREQLSRPSSCVSPPFPGQPGACHQEESWMLKRLHGKVRFVVDVRFVVKGRSPMLGPPPSERVVGSKTRRKGNDGYADQEGEARKAEAEGNR